MSACTCLSRSGLTIINLLFCVAGGALIFLGSFLFHEFAKYGHAGAQSLSYSLLPAFILIVIGILAIILGFIGCMAACTKDKKCLTGTYFTMLLLLLLGLVTGAILSMLYHRQLDDSVHEILLKGLDKYLENKDVRASVDVMQSELKCCGVDNTTDWLNTPWYQNQTIEPHLPYPESCCTQNNCTYDEVHDEHLNDKGCYKLVKGELRSHLFIVACVAAAFSVILIIGMVLSCVLLVQKSRRSREVQYVGLGDPDGGMRI